MTEDQVCRLRSWSGTAGTAWPSRTGPPVRRCEGSRPGELIHVDVRNPAGFPMTEAGG